MTKCLNPNWSTNIRNYDHTNLEKHIWTVLPFVLNLKVSLILKITLIKYVALSNRSANPLHTLMLSCERQINFFQERQKKHESAFQLTYSTNPHIFVFVHMRCNLNWIDKQIYMGFF